MCPECGMNLVPATKKNVHSEHNTSTSLSAGKHAGHQTSSFLTKFWIAFALTIPIFLYSELAQAIGIFMPQFTGSVMSSLVLGSIVYFYCGWTFLTSAYRELRAKLPGMMTLIALAVTSAYVFSVWTVFRGTNNNLFWELSSLIAIMLLGHWIEMKSVQGAQGALKELAKLLPDTAEVLRGGKTEVIALRDLRAGDIVLIKPGSKVPADGKIVEGRSDMNESIITGESKPVSKKIGDEVIAGSINGDGSLKVEIQKIGDSTFLAGVMRLVADAQASKSRLQMLSDRAALVLTLVAIVAGGTTFGAWLFAGAGIVIAVERLVAVLVITCPHALGLAIPLVASISTTKAAQNGLLVKSRMALESARTIDTVLFDKTGTLTKGEFGVDTIIAGSGASEAQVLTYAASINAHSEHSLAKAMVNEAKTRNISLFDIREFERLPGKGAQAVIEGRVVRVGSEELLAEAGIVLENGIKNKAEILSKQGKTVVYVVSGDGLIGSLALADVIREESRAAIQTLKEMGVRSAMITGDSEDVASWVSKELGIEEYFAKVMPGEKSAKVKLLQSKGGKVAMVGDGVNDAPALTQADLGVAIGAGTNVAIESAGIILVRNDPRDIVKIIKLSRLTYRKMIQNLLWATGYNVVALPLAAGVLAYKGIILQPALAAVFMSLSTVIVAVNAVLLRRQSL
ncbi:copper-translocating P-type ATPase [Candidatus Kaiserbacteria bacterium RIFCSPHIGHO2_02_FULL_55_25]|uniref:Copper-translocating P-type ATPase n=1 Tax=Candidatus Kaiserbacteria bacterium RIFCSPHIGHO2_02_FULL_55_25 TaxID=1798498 RepID=A0A1F6EAD8_9BACT|nr:MAG: copper-translocating P-type ATPase [Candidatus Kaiserbacteria bacterium RIFCSPHIGHO2_01_FULL_55_79]OGG70654.1 MAG: copper-translocating P-type ATPase [Candidatus Kaiserbacteria bacterium RIFCSPHIGHO2_02_FULL_55_25]OGG78213.1 MAG: copper-translocating P-type ATPase [Candidatus Kaiserbacteria bacterium RIFCSPHIGHO2_12_FULL_55_13]OGG82790.1 MAG: copper-translocating P-type ATPase [Candidatus Kaiserbacteria bacterium RIFCSPLOWO2_01_FULL_55_25]